MIKKNRGFSLLELIIAIAILVILTGFLSPQFIKYLEKSRRAVCLNTMDTIGEEFSAAMIDIDQVPNDDSAKEVLDKVIKGHGGVADVITSSVVYLYSGLCKSDGNYQCLFSKGLTSVQINCSKHGEWRIDVVTLKESLESINLTQYDIPKGNFSKYKTVSDYFNGTRTSIDSEAVSTDGRYGPDGSLAKILANEIKKIGINLDNKSWKLYKSGNVYELYLTDSIITNADINTSVSCTKYNVNAKEGEESIIKGEVKIEKKVLGNGSSFPVIDNSKNSFKKAENK